MIEKLHNISLIIRNRNENKLKTKQHLCLFSVLIWIIVELNHTSWSLNACKWCALHKLDSVLNSQINVSPPGQQEALLMSHLVSLQTETRTQTQERPEGCRNDSRETEQKVKTQSSPELISCTLLFCSIFPAEFGHMPFLLYARSVSHSLPQKPTKLSK